MTTPEGRTLSPVQTLEKGLKIQCLVLVQDFAHEIVEEWKGWLTGSLPMTTIAITGLVMPEWIHLPLWVWSLLIFVAGLILAMFRVYRELRRQRDALQNKLDGINISGPFMLVPLSSRFNPLQRISEEVLVNDL
jgi:hypothetical protein